MTKRKVKDAKDLENNELIYFKGHAKATYMSDGKSVEDAIKRLEGGETVDLSDYATKAELKGKVDKVDGKQLSTEDFTTLLKQKLEGLSNYDDTSTSQAIQSLQSQINTLVSDNASTAIESFNEIIAFLRGITDSEDLDSIIASIEQQIVEKQDKIADLETIRSGASKGATALQSVPSNYVTTTMLEEAIEEAITNTLAEKV